MTDTELRVTIDRIWSEMLGLMSTVTQLTNQIRWLTIISVLLGSASVLLSFVLVVLLASLLSGGR